MVKTRDLKPGDKVWVGQRSELQRGGGAQVTVVEVSKRYTITRQPCGQVIVKAKTDIASEPKVLVKFAEADRRAYSRLNDDRSAPQYALTTGRYLMSEEEHKVQRDARDARQLEQDAHRARGNVLREEAERVIRKALVDAGVPSELLRLSIFTYRSTFDAKHWKDRVNVSLDASAVNRLIEGKETRSAVVEYLRWSTLPVPGKDCIV